LRGDEEISDRLGRLGLLASALSGRALEVTPGEPGAPAWTNGSKVFVDAGIPPRGQVESLAASARWPSSVR